MKPHAMPDIETLKRREARLGRRFQKLSRSLVDECIRKCQNEFLRFYRSRGFKAGCRSVPYEESRLEVTDSRGSVILEIDDEPGNTWSGPPRLKITTFRGNAVSVEYIVIRRRFPVGGKGQALEHLEELIAALPKARLSFHVSGKPETFANFDALLEKLAAKKDGS